MFDNWKTLETIWGGSLVITSLTNSISLFKPSLQESEGETKKESEPEETVPAILALTRQTHQVMIFQKRNRQRDQAVTHKYVYKKREFMEKNPLCSAARSKFPKSGIRRFKSEG